MPSVVGHSRWGLVTVTVGVSVEVSVVVVTKLWWWWMICESQRWCSRLWGFWWDGFSLAVNFEGNGALMVAVFCGGRLLLL